LKLRKIFKDKKEVAMGYRGSLFLMENLLKRLVGTSSFAAPLALTCVLSPQKRFFAEF
jgi:hypothetical protein